MITLCSGHDAASRNKLRYTTESGFVKVPGGSGYETKYQKIVEQLNNLHVMLSKIDNADS
jgi:hypothetical protein